MAAADHPRGGARAGRDRGPRRDRSAGRARLGGARGALRRLDRHVLAGERQVGRLRRGLRLLRAVALRRGRDADARDDGARADPRARPRGRGGGRAPLLHGHPGPGPLQARLREVPRGRPAGAPSTPTSSAARRSGTCPPTARRGAAGGGHPARPPQRRDGLQLLRRGLDHGPLRGTHAHDRGRPRGRPGDLRRRHPQPRRDPRAARGDGLRAGRDQPHERADQHAQPAPRHEVRRPRVHGPVGGGEVDRDLPPDPPRSAVPAVRRARGEPRRAAAAGGQGGAQRRDDGQLPDDARQRARGGPRDVHRARPERRAPARQRRQPAPRQPLGMAGRRDARRRRGAAAGTGGPRRRAGRGPSDAAARARGR